jgi:hypothetical protein
VLKGGEWRIFVAAFVEVFVEFRRFPDKGWDKGCDEGPSSSKRLDSAGCICYEFFSIRKS